MASINLKDQDGILQYMYYNAANWDNKGMTIDNISDVNTYLRGIFENGKGVSLKKYDGSAEIRNLMLTGETTQTAWFSGYDDIPNVGEVHEAPYRYFPTSFVGTVTVSIDEMIDNMGSTKIKDIVSTRNKTRVITMNNVMARVMHAAQDDPKSIKGLKSLVPEMPNTGKVGGIDKSNPRNTYWRTKADDTLTANTTFTDFNKKLNSMMTSLTYDGAGPDYVLVTVPLWTLIQSGVEGWYQMAPKNRTRINSNSFFSGNAEIYWDRNEEFDEDTYKAYVLTRSGLCLWQHSQVGFKTEKPMRMNGQRAYTSERVWKGAHGVAEGRKQGVIF